MLQILMKIIDYSFKIQFSNKLIMQKYTTCNKNASNVSKAKKVSEKTVKFGQEELCSEVLKEVRIH